ncbi:AMP-binding protein [Pullulanibacillus sp. KACC 23026]|uniref:AMP-binding protein n=1 Tax=Pullulanibacillus sp. KACC 23026 TaxID=3028315 RepID=UPI0023AEE6F7|nr:AMP-binding protein [Pullulanibacillus sp. KACC 23026]WEG14810.1 AMP-binding protein [Pullulanibacillus sp. KACC 23026]
MVLSIPEQINLYDEMRKQAKRHRNRVILEDLSGSLTYDQFLLSVNVLSRKIKEMTLNEERVGLYLPNIIGQVVTLFALFKNNQNPCLLNFSMGTQNLLDCIETAELQTVLTSREFIKVAKVSPVIDEMEKKVRILYLEDLKDGLTLAQKATGFVESKLPSFRKGKQKEVILFTSGTENKPKGVILTHRNIYANIKQGLSVVPLTEKDRLFNPLPLFHAFGLTVGAVLPLLSNIKSFLYPSPLHYREIPKLIHKDQSTVFVATNTFFDQYAKHATRDQLATLRIVVAGAEKLKKDVYDKYRNEFGITLLQGYGTTETSPMIALNTPSFSKEGTVGKPLPLLECKLDKIQGIEEGGSLLLKGPNVMKGYLIHGKGYVPCGEWYNTGDIVTIDNEGFITIVSRLKRFSKIAGEMISLNKIEELALEHFGSSSFYAVSIPDKRKGEKIILFTTVADVTGREFNKSIKQKKMSSLYIPDQIVFINEIPLLQSGKPDYRQMEVMAKDLASL